MLTELPHILKVEAWCLPVVACRALLAFFSPTAYFLPVAKPRHVTGPGKHLCPVLQGS